LSPKITVEHIRCHGTIVMVAVNNSNYIYMSCNWNNYESNILSWQYGRNEQVLLYLLLVAKKYYLLITYVLKLFSV